jgi:sugar phosphate permease
MLTHLSWRQAFYVFGAIGIIWAVFFVWWFRDNPAEHPGVNAGERELLATNSAYAAGHGDVPWKTFFGSSSAWLLWAQYFCLSYVWYFYVTFLPTFLEVYKGKVSDMSLSLLAGVPLFCGGFGSLFSGFLTARVNSITGSVRKTRRMFAGGGFVAAGVALIVCANVKEPIAVMAAMGAASFFGDFVMPCAWGACMDVGGRFAGTFSGSMNMMGNLGGVVAPVVTGKILSMQGEVKDWTPIFYLSVGGCLLGALCWALLDPETPLDGGSHPAKAA